MAYLHGESAAVTETRFSPICNSSKLGFLMSFANKLNFCILLAEFAKFVFVYLFFSASCRQSGASGHSAVSAEPPAEFCLQFLTNNNNNEKMFSKYARVTSLGSKCLNFNPKQSSPQSFKWSGALLTQSQSVRLMSKSIADEILQAKQEQEKQEKEQKKESEGNSKKEYKPLTKWQKIGFYFAGIGAPVYLIAMAYLFCKLHKFVRICLHSSWLNSFHFDILQLLRIVMNMATISWMNLVPFPFSVKDFKDSKVLYTRPKLNLRNHLVKNFCRIRCRRVISNPSTLFVSNLLVFWFMHHGV